MVQYKRRKSNLTKRGIVMPDIRVEYNEKEETWDIFLYVNEKRMKKIAMCYEESYAYLIAGQLNNGMGNTI